MQYMLLLCRLYGVEKCSALIHVTSILSHVAGAARSEGCAVVSFNTYSK